MCRIKERVTMALIEILPIENDCLVPLFQDCVKYERFHSTSDQNSHLANREVNQTI